MTSFIANSVKLNTLYASMDLNMLAYYATIRFGTLVYVPAGTEVVMQSPEGAKLVCIRCAFAEDHYDVTCVSKDQYKALSINTSPFQGEATVKEMLGKWGLKTTIKEDSNTTWWMVPSLNFKGCVQALNKWADIPNGGAPRFYMDFGGNIMWTDFKLAYKKGPETLLGTVNFDNTDTEWLLSTPGNTRLLVSDKDKLEVEDMVNDDKFSWAKVIINDHTQKLYDMRKREIMHEYNYRIYTSRMISVSEVNSGPHKLGQCVSVMDKVKGIVVALQIPLPKSNESIRLGARVACQGLLEPK